MQEATIKSFDHFSLEKELQATLINQKFTIPTDIQVRAIPSILAGKDIFAQAKREVEKRVHLQFQSLIILSPKN